MKCKLHPKYKGKRKPRGKVKSWKNGFECKCWLIFYEKHPNDPINRQIREMGKTIAKKLKNDNL